jgi:hypothetical protein
MLYLNPHQLEMFMLICFGISWPFAIAKTIRSKTVKGKSITFNVLVLIGYCSGVSSKLIGEFDNVIWFYLINGLMIFTDVILYFKYNGICSGFWIGRSSPRLGSSDPCEKIFIFEKTVV